MKDEVSRHFIGFFSNKFKLTEAQCVPNSFRRDSTTFSSNDIFSIRNFFRRNQQNQTGEKGPQIPGVLEFSLIYKI